MGRAIPWHLLHLNSEFAFSEPVIPLHFLCTQREHPLQKIELFPTPFLHVLHGYFPESFREFKLFPLNMTFVLPTLTLSPFASMACFHLLNLDRSSSSVSAMMTKSSAYNNSQGVPVRNSRDRASSTMTKRSGLSTDPW